MITSRRLAARTHCGSSSSSSSAHTQPTSSEANESKEMMMMTIHMVRRLRKLTLVVAMMLGAGLTHAKLSVVATTPELGAIASAIGGGAVSVLNLAKATEDPHFVDARPTHIVTLNRAEALIEGGAELEIGWLPPLVEGARNPKILPGAPGLILASEGVQLIDVPASADRSKGDIHVAGNPHFMMDPLNA